MLASLEWMFYPACTSDAIHIPSPYYFQRDPKNNNANNKVELIQEDTFSVIELRSLRKHGP